MFAISYPEPPHRTTATCQLINHLSKVSDTIMRDLLDATHHRHRIANQQKKKKKKKKKRVKMAASMMASVSLKASPFTFEKSAVKGLPSLARTSSSFKVQASGGKKIKTSTPYGTGGGMNLKDGKDASGRKPTGKGVYQFVDKYGANVDGYSPIYNEDEWAPTGDVYAGGVTGLAIWAVTLVGILAGGALLVYNTSALSQ